MSRYSSLSGYTLLRAADEHHFVLLTDVGYVDGTDAHDEHSTDFSQFTIGTFGRLRFTKGAYYPIILDLPRSIGFGLCHDHGTYGDPPTVPLHGLGILCKQHYMVLKITRLCLNANNLTPRLSIYPIRSCIPKYLHYSQRFMSCKPRW